MSFDQDFLTEIVNVHWGGGLSFVTGDSIGYVRFGAADKEPDLDWELISQLQGPASGFNASSFAMVGADKDTPAFVIGGFERIANSAGDFFSPRAQIYHSSNGTTWRKVYEAANQPQPPDTIATLMNAVIWDPLQKAFYASIGHYENHFTAGLGTVEIRFEKGLRSSDGKDWTQVWSNDVVGLDITSYKSPLMNHCQHHEIKDHFGQNLPDSAMFFDETRKMAIGPANPRAIDYARSVLVDPAGRFDQVLIIKTDEDGNKTRKTVTVQGLSPIEGVAGAEGSTVWIAVGGPSGDGRGAIVASFDDGDSWTVVRNNDPDIEGEILAVSGSLTSDI